MQSSMLFMAHRLPAWVMIPPVVPPENGETEGLPSFAERIDQHFSPVNFSLIIPTYNERENLPELFARLDRVLAAQSFEVILVDDDSPDGTWAEAEKLRTRFGWLQVVRRRNERGLSSAVICGFRRARGQILGVMDADLQHDETRLPLMLRELLHADFVIATRRAEGGSDGKWCWPRRLTSWTATKMAKLVANVSLSDPMSGFFVMRRELYQAIDDGGLQPRGYKVLLCLYARAMQRFGADRLRLSELGYRFGSRKYGRSKLSSEVILEYLVMLIELRLSAGREATRVAFSPALPTAR